MRLIISAVSAPSELNGVSRHAANIVRGLLSLPDAPEIHFLAGAWQVEMYSRAIGRKDPRLHMHWLQIGRRNLDRILWYYRDLPVVAARLKADVVHLAYTMPLRAHAFCPPTVVSLHDLYSFDIPQNFGLMKRALNRIFIRQCLHNVNAIVCVSQNTRHRLIHRFSSAINEKAVTILNAVETAYNASEYGPDGVRNGQPFLLCIAQHRRNKNVPLALSIFERALCANVVTRETKLLIVGIPGPDTANIHAQIRQSKLQLNVILATGISDAELEWCYRYCLLLLAPSSIEGFGLPVAEALLAGCPVVCSDIPAFREIGGDQCLYVPFGDDILTKYESAIRESIAEPRRNRVSMAHLSPQQIGKQYLALYTKLVESPHTSKSGHVPLFDI
jgi:glycosyltransferase involved in cell wall biosynthesis